MGLLEGFSEGLAFLSREGLTSFDRRLDAEPPDKGLAEATQFKIVPRFEQ